MTIGFLNLALLAGLAALAIPPIIHFLNRRRHDVVDWGAMQFLQVSPTKKRRMLIEELLLMALRMGLIGLLVAAFAAPYVSGPIVAGWVRQPRDVVLVLDVSGSMGVDGRFGNLPHGSAWLQARERIGAFLDELRGDDRVAVCLAGQTPHWLVPALTTDHALVRAEVEQLDAPAGGADGPRAVLETWMLLREHGQARQRQIVIVRDPQKLGWLDTGALAIWQQLARLIEADRHEAERDPAHVVPSVTMLQVGDPAAYMDAPNYRLAPLHTPRLVAGVGQKLHFTTALHFDHLPRYEPPAALHVEVDGQPVQQLTPPTALTAKNGQAPLAFDHRFLTPGAHRVAVTLEADPKHDLLPSDNRQELIFEVVQELPILLIDGADAGGADSATYYLAKAFADADDTARVSFVTPRRTTAAAFDADAMLLRANPRPRVAILADVPRLTAAQRDGLQRFLEDGGGLLVALGPRVEAAYYNDELWRGGKGWLPARLERVVEAGEGRLESLPYGVTLDVRRFVHPALDLFRDEPNCTLGQPALARWWRLVADKQGRAVVGALLTNADPWLVEQRVGKGRVLVSALPMDGAWDGVLAKTWEFPVLAHELIYSLADARGGGFNLPPGQPLRLDASRWPAPPPMLPAAATLHGPGKRTRTRRIEVWPAEWAPALPGAYRLEIERGPSVPIVVQSDPRESDLTPATADDLKRLTDIVPLTVIDGEASFFADDAAQTAEIWWVLLAGVIGLLAAELGLTRRMALARGRS